MVMTVALATGLVSGSTHAAAKPTAARKCAAAKLKLVGKEVAALARCDAGAVAVGGAVDSSCETQAMTAFAATWAKAETTARGACATTNDAIRIEQQIHAGLANLESTLELAGPRSKCTAAKFKAAGRRAACELRCAAKGTLTGHAIDRCLAACTASFTKACSRGEAKGNCH